MRDLANHRAVSVTPDATDMRCPLCSAGCGADHNCDTARRAVSANDRHFAARRSVSATPDAPHDACEHSRDCIACGKRIEPANGLCFSCATTDPKVRTEASRATVPAPGGAVDDRAIQASLLRNLVRSRMKHYGTTGDDLYSHTLMRAAYLLDGKERPTALASVPPHTEETPHG